jgi:hypothetical protein
MLASGRLALIDERASGSPSTDSLGSPLRNMLKRQGTPTSLVPHGFGIRRDGDALLVRATPQDFSLRKHKLVQAILAVNDLFYLSVPVVATFYAFLNDENRAPSTTIVDALRNYDTVPSVWSARDSVRVELAA